MSTLLTGQGWGRKYTSLAKEISTWSKDPSTQVGAVVIGAVSYTHLRAHET